METQSSIRLHIKGKDYTYDLNDCLSTREDIFSAISLETGLMHFKVFFRDNQIKTHLDLQAAYLENEDSIFHLIIEEDTPSLANEPFNDSTNIKNTAESVNFPVQNGVLSEESLIQVINEAGKIAKCKLLECNLEFLNKRQEVYEINEEK